MMFAFRFLLPAVFFGLIASPGRGEDLSAAPAKEEATAVPSVPMADIVAQGEAAEAKRRLIETGLEENQEVIAIGKGLPGFSKEIDSRQREEERTLKSKPTLETLSGIELQWTKTQETLAGWRQSLTNRAKWLDSSIGELKAMEATWGATLAQAKSSSAPPEVIGRVESLISSINRTHEQTDKQRRKVLQLQTSLSELSNRGTEVVAQIKVARSDAMRGLFVREGARIWSVDLRSQEGTIAQRGQESFRSQWQEVQACLKSNPWRLGIHAAFFSGLVLMLRGACRRMSGAEERLAEDPAWKRCRRVVEMPVSTALVLSVVAAYWFYPEPPRLLIAIAVTASVVPTLLILRRLIEPRWHLVLSGILAFFITDGARDLTAALPLVSRWIFLVEMAAGVVFAFWLSRRVATFSDLKPLTRQALLLGVRLAMGVFAVALLANAFGYVRLSLLIGSAMTRSFYLAVGFSSLVAIAEGMVVGALSLPPLKGLGMVRRYRPLLWDRSRKVIRWVGLVAWGWATLHLLSLDGVVAEEGAKILKARPGSDSVLPSLGNLIDFGLTVWAAFLLSRFIRFVLEEDVYPRVRLSRGLPYAISTVLHYAVLLIGFFLAVYALGFDLTKVTILAGAFGVGLGFGLQNIVNNFVSGLILLFERPVNVGDVVQIGDASGVVNQIGIRASVIRTSGGSEIIVPNGTLISDRVTNWTRSNRQRGMEIAVVVMPGCDPACVIAVLKQVAAAHPRVADYPKPNAYFLKMSPAAFEFEVRVWTNFYDEWFEIRSDLSVAIHEALCKEGIAVAAAPAVPAVVK